MLRVLISLMVVALGGCASFNEPIDVRAEQRACTKSWLCRTFIDDRPEWIYDYASNHRNCADFAEDVAEQARHHGRDVYFVVGQRHGRMHAVAVVDGWVIDNGGTGAPVTRFPEQELDHWLAEPRAFSQLPERNERGEPVASYVALGEPLNRRSR